MLNRSTLPFRPAFGFLFAFAIALSLSFTAQGQVVIAPPPTVGSSNPVSPEPTVTRPSTTPCKVTLLTNQAFANYSYVNFSYAPPSGCAGPWAKVVFTADFTVSAGIQYDRSSAIYLAGATLFRGTTAEPRSSLSPSWHVENDVTDLSALFGTSQTGLAMIGNTVNSTYTGVIYANAELDFYPTSDSALAPVVPNAVIPIVADVTNPNQTYTSANPLSVSVTLPKNMTQLYLDVYSQHGGGAEEFWYLSTPNAQAAPYIDNQNQTALREADVSIDGTPAGVAPDRPYIFTGGLDPFLWEPITGAQTLNLKPYRISLTPFAGALSDGKPHTIVINDINTVIAGGYDSLNADLLVYTDPTAATTTGAITGNTLTANPMTNVTSNVNLDSSGNGTAEVNESLTRNFTITGYTTGSAGKVTTTVKETVNFANAQQLTNSATQNVVVDNLTSTVDSIETKAGTTGTTVATSHTENPLQAFINLVVNSDGSYSQLSTVELKDIANIAGPGSFTSNSSEDVISTDQLNISSGGSITGNSGQASTGTYSSNDSLGNSYSSTLNAVNNVLTGATTNSASTGSTLFVTATPLTLPQGSTVTITATVMPNNSPLVPSGRITFYSNGSALSILNLSNGSVSVGINFLRAGANVITATYDGDANFIPEASMNPLTVTVTPVAGSFTVGPASPATISVSPGASAIVSVPVTSGSTFTGTVALSCSGAPSGSTCVVNPNSVALVPSTGGVVSTQTVSVVVTTTANNAAANHVPSFGFPMAAPLGGISIAGIFLMLLPRRRGKGWRSYDWKSKTLTVLLFCGLGLCSVGALTGCGSGSTHQTAPSGGTPAGTYTITVTGTSGSITQTATFSLTVN